MKKLITILIVFLSFQGLKAQQDPHFTHYMFNTLEVNPGYAGSRDALTVTGLYRNQWIGFKGAPFTQTITAHAPIFNDKVGVGLSLMNDRIGPTNNTSMFADFAYRIPMGQSKKARLTFGLKGGINLMKIGLTELGVRDGLDPEFAQNYVDKILPNFGFGVYYYTDNFYVGASVPRILENYYDGGLDGTASDRNARQKRHYDFILGAMFKLGSKVKLKPTMLAKVLEAGPPELDFSALFYLLNDKFWIGPAFRTAFKSSDAVSGIVGVQLIDQLALGYSFDYSLVNETFKYNSGSHELMLRYDFIYNNHPRVKSPRYF
ncbi:MAG: type IX secretion system membrane protein PorP/SprF [Candidatus Heimdallarchaeota archaeon]